MLKHPRLRRYRTHRHRFGISQRLLLGVMGLLLLASFAVFGVYLYVNQEPDATQRLQTALRILSNGDTSLAASLAETIKPETIKKRSDHSSRYFLLGVNARTKAKAIEQHRISTQLNEEAVKYLLQSKERDFPAGFVGMGNYHLGMALFDLFRWDEAQEPLEEAAERYPIGRADAIERLVDIDLSRTRQDFKTALDRIEHWRSLPDSGEYDDQRTELKHMQTLLAKGDFEEAKKLQSWIPVDSPYRSVCDLLVGRCWRATGNLIKNDDTARNRDLETALESFQRALKSNKASVSTRRAAYLEVGKTYSDMGRYPEAISALSQLRLSSPYEPESLAAGLEELDILLKTGRVDEIIRTLDQINVTLYDLRFFDTDRLPLSEVRVRIVQLGNAMIDGKHYQVVSRFAKRLPKVCDDIDRLRLESRNDSKWAESLENQADSEIERLDLFRSSAKAYRELANKLPLDDEYMDWLWKSVENYRKGQAYKESNEILDIYLRYERRDNRSRGFLVRARNFKSLDRNSEASLSLQQVLSNDVQSPLIYDARLDLAKIRIEQEDFDEAEQLLLENLSGDLKPQSPVWRESLLELANMLFSRGERLQLNARNEIDANPSKTFERLAQVEASHDVLRKSIVRFEDFLRRYDSDPRRFHLLYKMAKAHQLASFWPEIQLREYTSSNEDTLNSLKSQKKELLTKSRQAYRKLRQEILLENPRDSKSSNLKELLRNSYFGEADLYFLDGDYDEAIAAYLEASNWFINEPESLEARKQIAVCQKRLGKFGDSRRSLEYAKSMLQRIPTDRDSRFMVATALDRSGWEKYLNSMLSELDDLEKKSNLQ